MMKKSIITHIKPPLVLAACLLLAALGPPAAEVSRAGSGRGSPPGGLNYTFTASGVCDFDVQVSVTGKEGVIYLPGGAVLVTSPATYGTFTNLSDPAKSVTLNVTGPAKVSTDQSGNIVLKGLGRGFLFAPNFGLFLFIGQWSFVLDSNTGDVLQGPTGDGQMINICDLIN